MSSRSVSGSHPPWVPPTDVAAKSVRSPDSDSDEAQSHQFQGRIGKDSCITLGNNIGGNSDMMDYRKVVTVKVGSENAEFIVHESFLKISSMFFKIALKSEWDASRKAPQTIELSEENPKVFRFYVDWLYMKRPPLVDTKNTLCYRWKILADCYVLGEILQDTIFKNDILKDMIDNALNFHSSELLPWVTVTKIICRGTIEGSPARDLLVDIWTDQVTENWVIYYEYLPGDFIRDAAASITRRRLAKKEGVNTWSDFNNSRKEQKIAPNTKSSV